MRLSLIGQVVRHRWRLLVVLAVAGALVGAGASLLFSPGYQTESNVLLQGPRQADELLTEAQVAGSTVVLDRAAGELSWQTTGTDLAKHVTTSVSNGNVVTITVSADSPERAQELANKVAEQFVRYSTQLISSTADAAAQVQQAQREALRQQVAQTNQRISDMAQQLGSTLTVESVQARTELEALRTSLQQAINNLNQADAATSQANMAVLGSAELPSGAASPTMLQFVVGGAVVFFLLGVLGHLWSARTGKRARDESEIAAALGSKVLTTVDIPDERAEAGHGWPARLRRLLGADRPWHLPQVPVSADKLNRDARYQRVLARVGRDAGQVLVVLTEDDAPAHRALTQLVAAAGGHPVLRVAEVTADRPVVPDGSDGVLVVLTAGSRTGWELVAIAEACADAGREIVGVVLAHPVQVRRQPPDHPSEAGSDREAMAGSV